MKEIILSIIMLLLKSYLKFAQNAFPKMIKIKIHGSQKNVIEQNVKNVIYLVIDILTAFNPTKPTDLPSTD